MTSPSLGLTESQPLLLVGTFYLLSCLQVLNAALVLNQRGDKKRARRALYEILLSLHLVLMAALANSACHGWLPPSLGLGFTSIELKTVMWINVLISCFGIALVVQTKQLWMIPETIILLASVLIGQPLFENTCSTAWFVVGDAAFFVFRSALFFMKSWEDSRCCMSVTAPIQIIQAMPEGVAYLAPSQTPIISNDAMRTALSQLGISVDYSITEEILSALDKRKGTWLSQQDFFGSLHLPKSASKVIQLHDKTMALFSTQRDDANPRGLILTMLDITEEWNLQVQEATSRAELKRAESALRELMTTVESIARKDALAKMRSMVHDVMGQRLSIIHRLLEESPSEAQMCMVSSAIQAMMDDISRAEIADPATELSSIIETLSFVGIALEVSGELPKNDTISRLLVNIIRESSTNAIRHSHATRVKVSIIHANGFFEMSVSSDGFPISTIGAERTGIKSMRDALNDIGGELKITQDPLFSLEVKIPSGGTSK